MIPAEAVEAAARMLAETCDPLGDWDTQEESYRGIYRRRVMPVLKAGAPHILNSAAHDLARADKTSHWDELYRKFEEQDGGDLSSESTAYLNGIADAMRFLQERAGGSTNE